MNFDLETTIEETGTEVYLTFSMDAVKEGVQCWSGTREYEELEIVEFENIEITGIIGNKKELHDTCLMTVIEKEIESNFEKYAGAFE